MVARGEWRRRGIRLGLLLLTGVIAFSAASAAQAQDSPRTESEEEKFYRAEDPNDGTDATAAAAPVDLHDHTFTLSTRLFQGSGGDAGIQAEGFAGGLNLQWLWSPFDVAFPVRFEVGFDIGWVDEHEYETGSTTDLALAEAAVDLDPQLTNLGTYPTNAIGSVAELMYGGPVMRVDFLGPSDFDLGLSLGIWGGYLWLESYWYCTDCNGTGPSNDSLDDSLTTLMVRVGAYFSYQFDWLVVGVDAGATYFQRNKLPMRFGIDFGLTLGVGF